MVSTSDTLFDNDDDLQYGCWTVCMPLFKYVCMCKRTYIHTYVLLPYKTTLKKVDIKKYACTYIHTAGGTYVHIRTY